MKAKMIAVAVAGMLVGCGSGGGSVEFQSQKGEPEVLEIAEYQGGVNLESAAVQDENHEFIGSVHGESLTQDALPEYKIETAKGPSLVQQPSPEFHNQNGQGAVNEVPEADMSRYGLVQEEKPEFNGAVHGTGLVGGHGDLLITQHGESLVRYQDVYAESTSKGESVVRYQDAYAESTDKGDPAFESVEELAICQRDGLQEQESCQAALSFINTGMSEAKGEFDKDPATFQIRAKGAVATAEGGIKREMKREPTYAEVIEYLVNSVAEDETMASRYTAAGYAIAAYYYVRGIPEGHTKTGNPGLCADKGFCGDEYLKYQWN